MSDFSCPQAGYTRFGVVVFQGLAVHGPNFENAQGGLRSSCLERNTA